MNINVERLGVLLDRGADIASAARQANQDFNEARMALKEHTGDDAARAALASRVERRRAAQAALARRANVWSEYCDSLRILAKRHGVNL